MFAEEPALIILPLQKSLPGRYCNTNSSAEDTCQALLNGPISWHVFSIMFRIFHPSFPFPSREFGIVQSITWNIASAVGKVLWVCLFLELESAYKRFLWSLSLSFTRNWQTNSLIWNSLKVGEKDLKPWCLSLCSKLTVLLLRQPLYAVLLWDISVMK